jgi:hypothetical protein
VKFHPASLAGTTGPTAGVIDYRLARRAIISEYRKGRLSITEVCDAHPELRRAAAEYSRPTTEPCPICEETTLLLVSYVFGPQLPAYGRCVATLAELAKLAERATHQGEYTCYVVEVCPACHWNHLNQVLPIGRSGSSAPRPTT